LIIEKFVFSEKKINEQGLRRVDNHKKMKLWKINEFYIGRILKLFIDDGG